MMRAAKRIFKGVPVLIPECFYGEEIVYGINRKDVRFNLIQAMHFILASIVLKGQQKRYSSGYVPLNAKILNSICGKRYREALTLLIDNNVIDEMADYRKGEFSRRYSLLGPYASSSEMEVLLQGSIGCNYHEHIIQKAKTNTAALNQIPFLTKWINPDHLKIIDLKAHSYIEFYRSEMVTLAKAENLGPVENELIFNSINRRTNYHIKSVERIQSPSLLHRTGRDNRLYTPVTSLLKELRTLLQYDGLPLVGIDVKASQPYLLTFALQKDFFEKKKKTLNIHTIYPSLILSNPQLYSIMVVALVLNIDFQGVKSSGFRDLNWEDDFYDRLCKLEAQQFQPAKRVFKTRSNAKLQMMFILFNKNNKSNGAKMFASLFPKEWKVIKAFHSLEGHQLPILLQRLESHLILDRVCKLISIELPNAPLITVHDSVYTTKKYAKKVHEIMFQELKRLSGLSPGLTFEEKSEEQIFAELKSTAAGDFKMMLRDIKKQAKDLKTISQQPVGLNPPLLQRFPEYGKMKLLSLRFLDDVDIEWQDHLEQMNLEKTAS